MQFEAKTILLDILDWGTISKVLKYDDELYVIQYERAKFQSIVLNIFLPLMIYNISIKKV